MAQTTSIQPNTIDAHVGRRLTALRHERSLSLENVATKLGLGADVLANVEAGRQRLGAVLIQKAAIVLGVSISDLFAGATIADEALEPYARGDSIWFSPEFVRLARCFVEIDDPEKREAIVNLVEKISARPNI
jgi:transcriptional regulator with XRE-family HTH domain